MGQEVKINNNNNNNNNNKTNRDLSPRSQRTVLALTSEMQNQMTGNWWSFLGEVLFGMQFKAFISFLGNILLSWNNIICTKKKKKRKDYQRKQK